MEIKKILITSSIIVFLAIIVVLLFFISQNPLTSPNPSNLEKCKSLVFNGEDKINLLFFADKDLSKGYSNFFLQTSPYSQYKDEFNFYYIDSYTPECEVYQDQAVLCRGKELTKKASSCPNDFIIVIKDVDDPYLRSSAFQNIISLNFQHPNTVLTHEFGHVFSNLADEYVSAVIPSGSKNCVISCDKFQNEIDGCFQGCSKSDYYRSVEEGVMRTLNSNYYGKFNEKIILEKINKKSKITGSVIENTNSADCSEQEYYLIEMSIYENKTLKILNITVEEGCAPSLNSKELQIRTILFTDGQSIDETQINGGTEEIHKGIFYIKIPKNEQTEGLILKLRNEQAPEIPEVTVNLEELEHIPCRIK